MKDNIQQLKDEKKKAEDDLLKLKALYRRDQLLIKKLQLKQRELDREVARLKQSEYKLKKIIQTS